VTKARAEVRDRRSGGVRRRTEQCPDLAVGSSGDVRLPPLVAWPLRERGRRARSTRPTAARWLPHAVEGW